MKKLIKFLLPFLVASSAVLSGCKKKNNVIEKTLLSYRDVHASKTTEIDIETMDLLTNTNKESFLFVVNSKHCACWSMFEPNLNKYLSENKAVCYRMTYDDIKDQAVKYGLTNISSGDTTFAIFENGVLKKSLTTADNSDIMYDSATFNKYMNENVELSNCFKITKDDVATIKASGKNAVIYFARLGCGDCASINKGIFRTYLSEHKNANKIYVVDCEEFRGTEQYQTIKDELGLSTVNNPIYGYGTGVFPFFSYISNNEYVSGAVIYNDSIEKTGEKYTISDSYYTQERVSLLEYTNTILKGKELSNNDVYEGGFIQWKSESADTYYKPILYSFLDTYLPRVTYSF